VPGGAEYMVISSKLTADSSESGAGGNAFLTQLRCYLSASIAISVKKNLGKEKKLYYVIVTFLAVT
jgi:hypothetical protein